MVYSLEAIKSAVLTLLAVSLVSAPMTNFAMAMPAANATSIACEIRVSLVPRGLRLEALAASHESVSGEYRLSVAKDSDAGSSRNIQSGAFQADAGKQQILAMIILEKSAIGHYRATLSLEWNDGHELCSSP
jgi:hypothetical protein